MRTLTVCIVNHNNSDRVVKCVKSVLDAVEGMNAQVIVIDNASKDNSVEALQQYIPRIELIASEKNLGYAGAGQLVYGRTESEYFTILNEDLIVDKLWAKELVEYMEANPEVAVAGCRIIGDQNVINVGTYSLIGENIWEAKTIKQFYVAGGGLIVRRSLVDTLFDADYFMYCEDVWVCWLARLKGHKIGFAEKAVIPQHIGSHKSWLIRKEGELYFIGERNKLMMFFTFYQATTLVKLIPLFVLFLSMRKMRRQALIWIFKNFDMVISKRREIQAQRKLPDREITKYMTSWISHHNKTINKISENYCRLVGLKTVETASRG
jgi:GT2 family glycosyltransferase